MGQLAEEKVMAPYFRFSEFLESSSYNNYLFEDVFFFSSGKNIKQDEASPDYEIPCVRYGELYHLYDEVIYQVINKTKLDKSELTFSEGNEILLPSAGEDPFDIGSASALTLKNIAIGRTINVLRPKGAIEYSHLYVSYYINQKLRKRISTLARGVSISNVYNSDLKTLTINLPEIEEQKKVTSFLKAVEDKLNNLRRKHEMLETYKHGLMQKIFSQEIRFKQDDGADFPDWEEKTIGGVFNWIKTNSLSREKLTNEQGKIQNIHYGDIHKKFPSHFYQSQAKAPFIIETEVSFPNHVFCDEGDVVIADASEDYDDIGKAIEIIQTDKHSLVAGLHTYIARPKQKLASKYAGYAFQVESVRLSIKKIAQGVSVLGISKTNLEKVKIPYPQFEEQQKIANILYSVDQKATALCEKIKGLESFKKALLQKMFV